MNTIDGLIIRNENASPTTALASPLDDHRAHVRAHLRHLFRKGMFSHLLEHFRMWKLQRKLGIGPISTDALVSHTLRKDKQ